MQTRRFLGGSLLMALTLALYAAAQVPTVAAQSDCTLTVDPQVATAGSQFHLHGSGFTPTQLILQKAGGQPVTVDLDLGGADPFDIPVGSRQGDEGEWTATAALPGTCSPSVVFTATLQSTDVVDDLLAPTAGGHFSLMLVLLVGVAGFAGGAVAARRLTRS